MSIRSRVIVPIAFSALAILAGCQGGTGTSKPTPPPSGGFTNTSLNGTYTFSVAGQDGAGIFGMAGSFVACGCSQGTISSGDVDLANPAGPIPGSISGNSTYQITSDGRGTARLFITTTANVALPEIDIDFVLTSSSHGLVIRFDGSGTGSGSIDLQPNAVAQSALDATPYAFFFSGSDLGNLSLSTVGALTVDSTGTITTGAEDFNHNGSASTQLALSGSVTVGTGTLPGQAILTTTFGTFTFSVYTVDATHLKLIETDGQAVLFGDLFTQPTPSVPAGTLVFNMSGLDSTSNLFVTLGVMTSDGTSLITNGSEDVNDAGLVDNNTNPATPFGFTGTFASTGGGRFQFTLTNYVGGSLFAAYPSSGGLLMLEIDSGVNAGVTGGTALQQQSGATVNASQGYGLNLAGEDVNNFAELDQVAEFKTTSTAMTGIVDQNDNFFASTGNLNGTYSISGGFGFATFNTGLPNIFFYPVDSSTALFITADPTVAALGSFQMQSAPSSAAQLSTRSSAHPLIRVLPHRRSASKQK